MVNSNDSAEGLTLDRLLIYVERALRGDQRLHAQLLATMEQLAGHPTAPEEERALGKVLTQILNGERRPDLSGLDAEAAEQVRDFVSHLGEK